ncbi:MAG: PTS lactose/cellobiose transporter subunit IIA [Defluviitaleaceae bacterium]|nr:PTS lactose/cellobiose transporter subunit IIA [Defluviitaleaceae bacterium]
MTEAVMQIIIHGGDARSSSIKAIRSARDGDFTKANALIEQARAAAQKAHEAQTEFIQAEARGKRTDVSLLMVHAQDHIMNALTVKDLAEEMIEEISMRYKLQQKLGVELV